MFEDAPIDSLLGQVRGYDFESLPVVETGFCRVEAIAALDRVMRAAQAEQVAQVAALYDERVHLMGLGQGDPGLSVIGELGMARNIGPTAAGTQLGLALGLKRLPKVFELFKTGVISEATARVVVNETCSLSVDDFPIADAALADKIPGLTTVRARQAAARIVIGIDAEAARVRAQKARADAHVSMHPDADAMATLRVHGPAEQIVATFNALDTWARGLRATGDPRSRGKIMSQTLVERVLGISSADAADVEVQVVMDADTVFNHGDTPADLVGYGPIAPDVAEEIIAKARHRWARRFLTDPVDGTLLARDARRRRYEGPINAYVRARDRRCRQPGCDCTIRDTDHIIDFQLGGATTADNGQGLCKRSHSIKHQPGWTVTSKGKATIWRTPTGHEYRSDPPPVLPRDDNPDHLRQ
jgi:hypothetical protein